MQGFDTRASRVACLVLAVFFMLTLVWARKSFIAWITIIFTAGLIVLCWLVGSSVALRFLILFIGVMSCLYSVVSNPGLSKRASAMFEKLLGRTNCGSHLVARCARHSPLTLTHSGTSSTTR